MKPFAPECSGGKKRPPGTSPVDSAITPEGMDADARGVERELLRRMVFDQPAASELRKERKPCSCSSSPSSYKEHLDERRKAQVKEIKSPVSSTMHSFVPAAETVAYTLGGPLKKMVESPKTSMLWQLSTKSSSLGVQSASQDCAGWLSMSDQSVLAAAQSTKRDESAVTPSSSSACAALERNACVKVHAEVLECQVEQEPVRRTPSTESFGSAPHEGQRSPRRRVLFMGRCDSKDGDCLFLIA